MLARIKNLSRAAHTAQVQASTGSLVEVYFENRASETSDDLLVDTRWEHSHPPPCNDEQHLLVAYALRRDAHSCEYMSLPVDDDAQTPAAHDLDRHAFGDDADDGDGRVVARGVELDDDLLGALQNDLRILLAIASYGDCHGGADVAVHA